MKKYYKCVLIWAFLGIQVACAQGPRHGLEAYYNFLGNCDDLSVYAVNGVAMGIVYTPDRWNSANSAIGCFPSDTSQRQYVQAPDTIIHEIQNQLTLCAWVRNDDALRTRAFPTVASKCYSENSPTDHSYFMGLNNLNKKWQMGFKTDSAMYILQSQDTATIGRWVHLVVLYNNGLVKNYVDGRLQDSVQTVGHLQYSTIGLRMGIGRINIADNQWIGAIDEVLLYDRILSDVQIQALANIRPTSITQLESNVTQTKIQVYPNPANDLLNLRTEEIWTSATIVDLYGRVLGHFENPTNPIEISNLDNGLYFLNVSNSKKNAVACFQVRRD